MLPEDIHLREIRDESRLRQIDVCEVLDTSISWLSKLETGKRFPLKALVRLGRLYQRHPWDFYTLRGFPLPRQRQTDVCVLCGSALSGGPVPPLP